jgi:hypothetical protein
LFVRAEDWTGVDSNSDGVPDWWLWEYFGTLALNATNLDGDGNTLLADYTNNVVPHTFSFTGITVTNNYVSTTTPAVQLAVTGYPYYVAVLVDDTNLNNAAWNTYSSSTVAVNLGLTEGWHEVQIGLRGYADAATNAVWQWKWLNLDYTSPQLAITQPASGTVSVPMIQVHGYASEALASITYDISNAAGIFTGQTGYLADEFWDANLLAFTTNYFQCYDVALTNGLNQIAVHVFDLAGNETTSNLNITVNYAGDTVAPALTLLWPTNGTPVSGASFTLQAQVDDYTATVTASFVDTNGVTNTVTALVERSGLVWAGLPLTSGTNTFALTIADAAGNVTVTNLTVTRNDAGLTMNPLTDGQLNQSSVSVTGTVGDASYSVTVNGVAATVSSNLTWVADNVPVNLVDTASLEVVVRDSVGNLVTTHDYAQPLSAKIRLMSYSGYRHFQTAVYMNNYFVEDETVNWEHSEGGSWNYNAVNEYHNLYLGSSTYLISADGKTVALPEFDLYDLPPIFLWPVFHDFLGFQNGNSFNPPWEYSSLANGNLQRSLRTQVMIEPQGQAPLHTTKVYLVRAEAKEFSAPFNNSVPDPATANFSYLMFCTSNSLNGTGLPEMNPTNYVGDVPLPPEWLRINGQPLNRTTITNADGTVEGVMLLSAPAGVNVPLTVTATQVHQYQDYTFNVTLGKTKEDWQQMVQQEIDGDSGVAVENYLAGNGFLNNRANIQAVYAFYQKLFTEQSTEFYWAGLAKLAGAPVYAGLSDAQHGYDLLASMVSTNSPYDATNNLETMASIQNLQNTLIGMNIAILNDLAWQFEAYKNGGLDALKEIDAVDPTHTILDIASWQKIDQGIQTSNSSLIQQGNKDLLQREQQQVLAFGYQQLSAIPNVTAIMSLLAKNPVPGGPDFATLEPSGSIAIFNDRWDWIIHSSNGMWPLWISANSATQLGWVAVPLTTYATNYILIPPVIQ